MTTGWAAFDRRDAAGVGSELAVLMQSSQSLCRDLLEQHEQTMRWITAEAEKPVDWDQLLGYDEYPHAQG